MNNFAVNTHYAGRAGRFEYLVGAGYLDGTIYDADTPEHIDPTVSGPRNGVLGRERGLPLRPRTSPPRRSPGPSTRGR